MYSVSENESCDVICTGKPHCLYVAERLLGQKHKAVHARIKSDFLFARCDYELRTCSIHLKMESDEAPPLKKRKYCFHCSKYVGYSTYYRHRERYFDVASNQWTVVEPISTRDASGDARSDVYESSLTDVVDTCDEVELCSEAGDRNKGLS